ncbi:argininosuccinate synthase [Planctomycetota bacterium]|nr:argininosuccinate synthase [Planctomycetota bacterium]
MKKVVLAFSGGLGTNASLHLLKRRFGSNVITFTANLGQKSSTEDLCERATALGAASAHIADLRERFACQYIWPAIRAGAVCESGYALAHALARPLIVAELVKIAREEGAQFIAHGCAGKSNDQVRFEVSAAALAPDLQVLSPLRDNDLLRLDELVAYCDEHNLPSRTDQGCRFSITENLMGTSLQWDRAPDTFDAVPDAVYRHTRPLSETPNEPQEVLLSFQGGTPTAIDGEALAPMPLVERLAKIAGAHGVGRVTAVEDRLIGIKMIEVYEQPAATTIHTARRALERLVLPPDLQETKTVLSRRYADLAYQGFWFSELRESLDAFFTRSTEFVTGDVRLRLYKGSCEVTGLRSRYSLYNQGLADPTSGGDLFTHGGVRGYMDTLSQPLRRKGGWQPKEAEV